MHAGAAGPVPSLFRGYGVVAVVLVAFVVATDVLALAVAPDLGALLLIAGLPWPLLVGAVAGYGKVAALAAMALGLAANWTLLVLGTAWVRRRREISRVRLARD